MSKEPEYSVMEKLFILMAWKLNGLCQGAVYDKWSDHFARTESINYYWNKSRQLESWKFSISDLRSLSKETLFHLGFRKWESDNTWLLPLWLFPHMEKGPGWFGLWNKPEILTDDYDLDHRGGCLAIWFQYDESVPIEPEQKEPTMDELLKDAIVVHTPEELQAALEAQAWVEGIAGGSGDDGKPVIHPHRDDEHQ